MYAHVCLEFNNCWTLPCDEDTITLFLLMIKLRHRKVTCLVLGSCTIQTL